ncbi:peptidase S41 [Mucilaginibacter sp. JRF]|uniref:S41 family peptidase n=1 Tax=Mucilaginibacter sp. JRF TaxID=2780088 RepID=UPI0018822E46|nr:S41 family peptidase [Mucilaginibacter sp. JRF]MBE9585276.1 peptidase S41 [Mucilaginibacter sp. JRF]
MMKKPALLFCLFFSCLIISCNAQTESPFNGGFEQLQKGKPVNWINFNSGEGSWYLIRLDSTVAHSGKYSVSLTKGKSAMSFGAVTFRIPKIFDGDTVRLEGYVKTKAVKNGYAGLWLRIDGRTKVLELDNMNEHGITGDQDWIKCSIKVPYNKEEATNITGGGIMVGEGQAWVDDLKLYIDDKPVEQAKLFQRKLSVAERDTVFKYGSKINAISVTPVNTKYLSLLGQLWGFLKYHHPAVAKGDYNWDAELFRVMPAVIAAKNDAEASAAFEKWMDKLGVPPVCNDCTPIEKISNIKLKPDYGALFTNKVFKPSLTAKLKYILANRNTGPNIYISFAQGVGNPIFIAENTYAQLPVVDAGYRMLSLYRYWNIIKYFFPNRHLIGENWVNALDRNIAIFAQAGNSTDYALAVLKLSSSIHEGHAFFANERGELERYKGTNSPPFQAKFIEGKLLVTGYYKDTLNVKQNFKVGDVITKINGVSVAELIEKYRPLSIASNDESMLRDMPREYLLRSPNKVFEFEVQGTGAVRSVNIEGMDYRQSYNGIIDNNYGKEGYYLRKDGIGYVYPAKYKNEDLFTIKQLFKNSKGIIVDMRCYPSAFMPFTFGNFIKGMPSPFVKFSTTSASYPGLFTYKPAIENGALAADSYKGKVVVIVNQDAQSQAEYTTIAFQSSPNVTVIGSRTAGADGNISNFPLPGALGSTISGIGVYYPDGTETQRVGVKIDVPVKPTIKGIREGRDELLEKAVAILNDQH